MLWKFVITVSVSTMCILEMRGWPYLCKPPSVLTRDLAYVSHLPTLPLQTVPHLISCLVCIPFVSPVFPRTESELKTPHCSVIHTLWWVWRPCSLKEGEPPKYLFMQRPLAHWAIVACSSYSAFKIVLVCYMSETSALNTWKPYSHLRAEFRCLSCLWSSHVA